MKVMLCGEGPHDVGRIANWSIRAEKMVTTEGWLQPLVRKYIDSAELEFEIVPRSRLVTLPGRNKTPLPPGHGAKAYIAKFRASTSPCTVLIYMVDADTNRKKEWQEKRQEVLDGFAAHDDQTKSVACIPMSASESWLLCDSKAWADVSGKNDINLPAKPEKIWGKRFDPNSNHPHPYFSRTCAAADLKDDAFTRVAIMEASQADRIKDACPVSFKAFDSDLTAAVS